MDMFESGDLGWVSWRFSKKLLGGVAVAIIMESHGGKPEDMVILWISLSGWTRFGSGPGNDSEAIQLVRIAPSFGFGDFLYFLFSFFVS